ncbi:hypothetical protein [Microbulbifer sp. YPW1]|uniref:hypothetical protein n=1 Tax=Microbulbifer sp. YPW1 TaxID=2745199 RepID=UPI00159A2854|nr:hypothetical protein [Microbulbifer sp. YPW1]QKX17759.1 hypothetical protein HUW35_12675 [Microbulbifer sp. YPW1]
MESKLDTGEILKIKDEGTLLEVYTSDELDLLFSVQPPEYSGFYTFARHSIEGECPIVSFEPSHKINGWQDWYYKVNLKTKSIERLNPWR